MQPALFPFFRLSSALAVAGWALGSCGSLFFAPAAANAQLVTIPLAPDANQPPANVIGVPCVDDFCTPTAGSNVIQYWDTVKNHPNALGAAAGLSTSVLSEYLSWFMATNAHRDPLCSPTAVDQWGRTNARSGGLFGTNATDTGPGIFDYVRWDGALYLLEGTLPQPPLPATKSGYSWRVETTLATSYPSNTDLFKAYQDEIDAGRPNLVSFQHWHLNYLCTDAGTGIEYYDWLPLVFGTNDPGFNPNYPDESELPPNEEWNPDNLGHATTGVGYNMGFTPPCSVAPPQNWIIVHDNFSQTGTDVAVPFLYDVPGNQTWMTALTRVVPDAGLEPEVAIDVSGDRHVVWWDGDNQIYYEQKAVPGRLVGTPIKTGKQPDIAVNFNTGEIMVVFSKLDAALVPNIYATTSTDGGTTWSPDVLVSTIPICGDCRQPSVIIDASGHTHAAWEDDCDLVDLTCGADFEIFSNDKPAGGVWGWQQQVTNDQSVPYLDDVEADLATDGSDVFLVFERDQNEIIYLEGSVLGGATNWQATSRHVVNITTGQRVRVPAIAADFLGDAYVVWADLRTGRWQTYHQAQNSGAWQASDIRISNASTAATSPDITARTEPTVTALYISWEEEIPAGNYEIFTTALLNDRSGNITGVGYANNSETALPSLKPAMVWDDLNRELDTAWTEDPVELPEPGAIEMWLASLSVLIALHWCRRTA